MNCPTCDGTGEVDTPAWIDADHHWRVGLSHPRPRVPETMPCPECRAEELEREIARYEHPLG